MKQGNLQNVFDLDVHSANPASLCCPLPIALCGREQNQVRLKLPGSYIYQEQKQGAISCWQLFWRKLVTLSLLRQKGPAILTLRGAALEVTDMNERPCTLPPPFPPPKYNSFIQEVIQFIYQETMMEKSMAGLSLSPHLLLKPEPLFAHLFRHFFSYSPLQVIKIIYP